jgi:SPRY domain
MTLNSSGPISLGGATAGQSVNLELGYSATAQISFNDAAVRTLTGTTAGTALVMPTNFYGKSSGFTLTYLVVGGGGGGGYSAGGGGGGGQVLSGTTAAITCGASKTYTITVGTGGTADTSGSNGTAGGTSSITAACFSTLSAVGGGYGGSTARAAGAGASGGGGGTLYGSTTGGSATAGSAGGSGFALPVVTWVSPAAGSSIGTFSSGTAISTVTLSATATAGTVQYTVSAGALPTGLSLGLTTGQITGTPTQTGSAVSFTVSAVSSLGGSAVTRSFTWTVNTGASYLLVAGGGGGGGEDAGGGGGGGFLTGTTSLSIGTTYTVLVGAGGTGGVGANALAGNGGNSQFAALTAAVGGGGGGSYPGQASNGNGKSGGSGGGGGAASTGNTPGTGGSPTASQGYAGGNGLASSTYYAGGGGGGAAAVGSNASAGAGNGGAGKASNISGTCVYYAGGGGGGSAAGPAFGGVGGGGNGYTGGAACSVAGSGTVNTGGGGGGGGDASSASGGNGGSGVVIVSYAGCTPQFSGGAVTLSGGNVIHTFRNSGYLTGSQLLTKSLRFRGSSVNAYLNRTPATTGNRQLQTYSMWFKRGKMAVGAPLFSAGIDNVNTDSMVFNSDDKLAFFTNGTTDSYILTTQVFRDPAAWYHLVFAIDTTQATASNRYKMYINGVQVTAFGTANYPSQNYNLPKLNNSSYVQGIGTQGAQYWDGEMTQVNFIDGQALTPNYFGTFNQYGVWQPIAYAGTYGTNGYYLPFTNTTSTTTLGYDSSGNSNNWTVNNFSLTAGATYDSMNDVPTLTSATASNYAVWNPLSRLYGTPTITDGNLKSTGTAGGSIAAATVAMPTTGKWYAETTVLALSSSVSVGVCNQLPSRSKILVYQNNGQKNLSGTVTAYGSSYTTNDVIGIAVDCDVSTVTFYKNNVSQGAISFSSASITSADMVFECYTDTSGDSIGLNCGQQPWTYTPPSGFVALNAYNV